MLNFPDTFKTRKRSFIRAFSFCMTVPFLSSPEFELFHLNSNERRKKWRGLSLENKQICIK